MPRNPKIRITIRERSENKEEKKQSFLNSSNESYRIYNLMDLFIEGMGISGGFLRNHLDNIDNQILEMSIQESILSYETQEKKPHIKLAWEGYLASSDSKNTCVICKNDIIKDEKIYKLNCGHIYHEECISKWVMYKPECPICRKKIAVAEKIIN